MIITGVDERNLLLAIDVLQAKMLVEVLRSMAVSNDWQHYVNSSTVMIDKGFPNVLADEVKAVLGQHASAMGFWTDKVERKEPQPAPDAANNASNEESPTDGDSKKPTIH